GNAVATYDVTDPATLTPFRWHGPGHMFELGARRLSPQGERTAPPPAMPCRPRTTRCAGDAPGPSAGARWPVPIAATRPCTVAGTASSTGLPGKAGAGV